MIPCAGRWPLAHEGTMRAAPARQCSAGLGHGCLVVTGCQQAVMHVLRGRFSRLAQGAGQGLAPHLVQHKIGR